MNGLYRTPDQIKHSQQVCRDLLDAIHEDSSNSHTLLETIIDEYVYKCNEDELEELEDMIVNQFGYDDETEYRVR